MNRGAKRQDFNAKTQRCKDAKMQRREEEQTRGRDLLDLAIQQEQAGARVNWG